MFFTKLYLNNQQPHACVNCQAVISKQEYISCQLGQWVSDDYPRFSKYSYWYQNTAKLPGCPPGSKSEPACQSGTAQLNIAQLLGVARFCD